MRIYLAALIFFACLGTTWARDMASGSLYYNFSLYSLDQLGASITPCDAPARRDPNLEWMCGSYFGSHEVFIEQWEAIINSDIIRETYNIEAVSDWYYYNDANGVDFYAKTYRFGDEYFLASYDNPDTADDPTRVFLGVGDFIGQFANGADGVLQLEAAATAAPMDPTFTSSSVFKAPIDLIFTASRMQELPCNEETDALAIKCGLVEADALRLLLGMNMAFEEAGVVQSQGEWEAIDDGSAQAWFRSSDTVLRVEVVTITGNIHGVFFREFAE